MLPPRDSQTLQQCADWCSGTPGCISFNFCSGACGIQTWSMAYVPQSSATCDYYRRLLPRNDTKVTQAVPWALAVPAGGVVLTGGPLADTFTGNVQNYLRVRDPLDMLHFFAQRWGAAQPVGRDAGARGGSSGADVRPGAVAAGSAVVLVVADGDGACMCGLQQRKRHLARAVDQQ
jgi:hypothetical protein